jgi:hypothetical protein
MNRIGMLVASLFTHYQGQVQIRKVHNYKEQSMNKQQIFDAAFVAYEHGLDAETHDLNLADYWYTVMTDLLTQYLSQE